MSVSDLAERHEMRWAWGLAAWGIFLRIALFWRNPAGNAYDNHFEPIAKILATWQTPAKDACWECCQPPVFYWVSAGYAWIARRLGASNEQLFDVLHVLPLLFGILLLPVTWRILRRLRVPVWIRLAAFALVCLLPRMIYMSALHSNDTASYLSMALAILAVLKLLENDWAWRWAMVVTVAIVGAVFTKFTALALGPAFAVAWLVALRGTDPERRRRILLAGGIVLAVSGGFVLTEFVQNHSRFGQIVPEGPDILGVELKQPPGDALDFFDFRPWTTIAEPVLTPRNVGSFWTQLHARAWFDLEPKFLYYSDPDPEGWAAYYRYLRGQTTSFPAALPLSPLTRTLGGTLITLGLAVAAMIPWGLFTLWRERAEPEAPARVGLSPVVWTFLLVLLLANLAALIQYAHHYPFTSHMKTSYLMGSWPVVLALVAVGLQRIGPRGRKPTAFVLGAIAILVTLHIARIVTTT